MDLVYLSSLPCRSGPSGLVVGSGRSSDHLISVSQSIRLHDVDKIRVVELPLPRTITSEHLPLKDKKMVLLPFGSPNIDSRTTLKINLTKITWAD
jgi:hypothetical protein